MERLLYGIPKSGGLQRIPSQQKKNVIRKVYFPYNSERLFISISTVPQAKDGRITGYGRLNVWDLGLSPPKRLIQERFDIPLLSIASTPDGRYIVIGGAEEKIFVLDILTSSTSVPNSPRPLETLISFPLSLVDI